MQAQGTMGMKFYFFLNHHIHRSNGALIELSQSFIVVSNEVRNT